MSFWEFVGMVIVVAICVRVLDRLYYEGRRIINKRRLRDLDLLSFLNDGNCVFCGWTEVKAERKKNFETEICTWKYTCMMCDREWTMTAKNPERDR